MYVIDTKLKEREAADEPIQCGILGAGEMTLGLVNQIERHVPGMRVAAIYNRTILKAERCYRTAGHETIVQVENAEQADSAIVERNPATSIGAGCLAAKDRRCGIGESKYRYWCMYYSTRSDTDQHC